MTQDEYMRTKTQLAVLRDIAAEYNGKTIGNIIQQLEAITNEYEQQ